MALHDLAYSLIRSFEGEKLTAYRDSGGIWTIGIGHTGPDVHEGQSITHDEAVALFEKDSAPLATLVAALPIVKAAAYMSFGYNCGRHALEKVLNGEDTIMNPKHQTDHTGRTIGFLATRRALENSLIENS